MIERDSARPVGSPNLSFESRIAIAALITAVGVMIAASGLFMLEQWQAEQRDLRRDQASLAQIMAGEVAPVVSRGEMHTLRQMLVPLVNSPTVRSAVVADIHGRLILSLRKAGSRAPTRGSRLLESRAPLLVDGRAVGELVIAADSMALSAILPRYLAVCGALFFATAGLGLFIGRWLAGRVIRPVNRLSQAMRDVTDSGDYSGRVPSWAHDEFGLLTESFNTLLTQLQANDGALHRAMIELVDARDAAQTASVMKSQFLTNMSHEIRTPLNGVLAMAQVIENGELSVTQREHVELIRRSGEELLAIINDVLDISKIEAGKMEIEVGDLDADALGRHVKALFAPIAAAKPHIRFQVDVGPEAHGLRRGDAARVGQILNNLVSNALKFTAAGYVSVVIEGVGYDGRAGLRFIVSDTGIGIPPNKLPILFERFSQADPSDTRRFGGAGLGLALCRELTHMMRGEIEVQSVEGKGSTFTVTLPMMRAASADDVCRLLEPASPVEDNDRPLRVLAAEDIPTNQIVLRTVMESFGAQLEMVENGRQAVEAWRHGEFDLILMDIQMPIMDGVAAARAIRAAEYKSRRARTPIIAVSANAMAHHITDYLAQGMDAHVAKPIELTKLHSAIEIALASVETQSEGETTRVA